MLRCRSDKPDAFFMKNDGSVKQLYVTRSRLLICNWHVKATDAIRNKTFGYVAAIGWLLVNFKVIPVLVEVRIVHVVQVHLASMHRQK